MKGVVYRPAQSIDPAEVCECFYGTTDGDEPAQVQYPLGRIVYQEPVEPRPIVYEEPVLEIEPILLEDPVVEIPEILRKDNIIPEARVPKIPDIQSLECHFNVPPMLKTVEPIEEIHCTE